MSPSAQQDSRTEATRLMCAGTYLDIEFRRRVIEELVEHEERPIAPSLGVDVVPVLTHALRARKQDAMTALLLLVLWGPSSAWTSAPPPRARRRSGRRCTPWCVSSSGAPTPPPGGVPPCTSSTNAPCARPSRARRPRCGP
ncbi:hypothetical protein ACFQ2B_11665 [Streptomyces stramineus]